MTCAAAIAFEAWKTFESTMRTSPAFVLCVGCISIIRKEKFWDGLTIASIPPADLLLLTKSCACSLFGVKIQTPGMQVSPVWTRRIHSINASRATWLSQVWVDAAR